MEINTTPVNVSISIENILTDREAFYNICFITNNEAAPRTLEVRVLNDLLKNGYDRDSLAYNFCVGVFAQQSMPVVYVRAKRAVETYEQAYDADSNNSYYFLVIESKNLDTVSDFTSYVNSVDDFKLVFHSNQLKELDKVSGLKTVSYYQELFNLSDYTVEDYYLGKAYDLGSGQNFVSSAYPTEIDEDGYFASVKPLDITLREILKERSVDNKEGYIPSVKPLDISLINSQRNRYVDDKEAYIPSVKPLDITLKSFLKSTYFDPREGYIPSVKPLNITLKRVLIEHTVKDKEGYMPSVKPLDITLKTGL